MEREGERRKLTLEKDNAETEDLIERVTLKQEVVEKETQAKPYKMDVEGIIRRLILIEQRFQMEVLRRRFRGRA